MSSVSRPQSGTRLTKRHFFWLLPLVAIGCLFVAYSMGALDGLIADTSEQASVELKATALPVNVATVTYVDSILQSRTYTGAIRARHRSDLGFEIPGRITKVNVDEGVAVNKGDILAELDTETAIAQKGALLARLAQAKSRMEELDAGPRMETIRAARAEMDAAQSRYQNAVQNLNRRKKIRSAISVEEYDQAVFAERSSKANLNAAREKLSELESGTRQEQLDAQTSALKQLEASINEVDVAISKAKLLAPFSGVVTRRYLDPGSIAAASVPVIKLVEQQHLEAWIGLPVSIVSDIDIDSKHEILVEGQPYSVTAKAKIRELDPATMTQTILFVLEPGASEKVVSGQLCEISLTSKVESSGFWIPTSALSKGVRGLWSVMVVGKDESGEGCRIQRRGIDIIKTESARVLVKGTIVEGDQIVVDGTHRITDRQLVKPIQ